MENFIKKIFQERASRKVEIKVFKRYKELGGGVSDNGEMLNRVKDGRARQWVREQEKIPRLSYFESKKVRYGLFLLVVIILLSFGWRFTSTINLGFFTLEKSVSAETKDRPYLGVTEIKLKGISSTNFIIESILKNTGAAPAKNIKIYPSYTITTDGKPKKTILKQELPLYLMPSPTYITYTLRIGGNNFDKFGWDDNIFILNLKINYAGATANNYTIDLSAKYNPIDKTFDIIRGDIN